MTIAHDVEAERAAVAESLSAVGASAPVACAGWTAGDLAAHLVAEERLGGVTTFAARSLVVRGISVRGGPTAVNAAIRLERRHGFAILIDRLRRPMPRLLLRPRVATVALFEYWTHHDDLLVANDIAHAAPVSLAEVVPVLMRYQAKRLPADIRVTVRTLDGNHGWSVGPTSGPEVTVDGLCPDLVRWLAGRRPLANIAIAGPAAPTHALRAFIGHV